MSVQVGWLNSPLMKISDNNISLLRAAHEAPPGWTCLKLANRQLRANNQEAIVK